MYNIATKTCVLCDTKIMPPKQLCDDCYKLYGGYKQEMWFHELDNLQSKQDKIDKSERFELPYDTGVGSDGKQSDHIYQFKRKIGKPGIDWITINKVLDIYDSNLADVEEGISSKLSLRDIADILENKISFLSVRNILITYRPDYNKVK